MEFDVGKEFEEDLAGVDDRKCMVSIRTVTTDQKKKKKTIKTIDNPRPFTDNICKPFCVSVPKIIPVTFFNELIVISITQEYLLDRKMFTFEFSESLGRLIFYSTRTAASLGALPHVQQWPSV